MSRAHFMSGPVLILLPSFSAALLFLLTRHRAPYPGSAVIKALGCALLAALAWPAQPLLALALLLSAVGDWLLALRGERHFRLRLGTHAGRAFGRRAGRYCRPGPGGLAIW